MALEMDVAGADWEDHFSVPISVLRRLFFLLISLYKDNLSVIFLLFDALA